jgi:hypothetical protein
VKVHRAVTLVVMMLLGLGSLTLLIMNAGGRSLVALGVVVVAAAIGGVAFSWKRYYRR